MITLPSVDELDHSRADFDRIWGGVDEVLYALCRQHPRHDDLRTTAAKLALINRVYAAGMERRVSPRPGEQAIAVIAEYVYRHGADVDEILGELSALSEPLSVSGVSRIVDLHGRFTRLLVGVTTDGKAPRSFAAKYLHFHAPVVPLYDSYVAAAIVKRVRWDPRAAPFPCPPAGDGEYYNFCVRFWRVYVACRRQGLDVTVKSLDTLLWAASTADKYNVGDRENEEPG